jgi:hypothetical protein
MKVWCSKPATTKVSSRTAFIKVISALHSKQRIMAL